MKCFVYSVFDRASKIYDRPWIARSELEAQRAFTDEANRDGTPLNNHPDDYTLFLVGYWDDNTGELVPQVPTKVCNGAEVQVPDNVVDFPVGGTD